MNKRSWLYQVLCLCLLGAILFNSCGPAPGAGNKHPDFQTEYTIEEHIGRIRARTEEHFIGFIENDEYYARVRAYTSYKDEPIEKFVDGRNPYALCGFDDFKKYCNSQSYCAVQTDEGVLQIFESPYYCGVEFDMEEKRFDQRIISEEEQKSLMTYPYFANFRYYLY